MRCEIVAVGTELLLGQIVDTNSSWIGERLALAGIDSHFQTKVGDNLDRIVDVLRLALSRSDAVIACGGLGPTQDDITREAIALVMGVPLVRDESMADRIRHLFTSRGREMPAINLRQADVPRGASTIPEMPGTAPGLICPVGEKVVYAVPGVPWEMQVMLSGTVIPDLQRRAGISAVIKSRTLRTWGQSESGLAEMLAGRIAELDEAGNPTLAFLASGMEGIKVRITAKAPDEAAADRLLAGEEAQVSGILGDLVFGFDDDTVESVALGLLRAKGLTLGVAEPLTGGLVSSRLTAIPASKGVFRGAVVASDREAWSRLLGVGEAPEVSEAAAKAMAEGARRLLSADVGAAAVGTDPGEPSGHPPGTVFLGLALRGEIEAYRTRLPGDRERLRQFSVISLLNFLRLRLMGRGPR